MKNNKLNETNMPTEEDQPKAIGEIPIVINQLMQVIQTQHDIISKLRDKVRTALVDGESNTTATETTDHTKIFKSLLAQNIATSINSIELSNLNLQEILDKLQI